MWRWDFCCDLDTPLVLWLLHWIYSDEGCSLTLNIHMIFTLGQWQGHTVILNGTKVFMRDQHKNRSLSLDTRSLWRWPDLGQQAACEYGALTWVCFLWCSVWTDERCHEVWLAPDAIMIGLVWKTNVLKMRWRQVLYLKDIYSLPQLLFSKKPASKVCEQNFDL